MAQQSKQFDINSNTVFKDKDGNQISFETFIEWTSGNGYEIEPVFYEDGSLKEIVLNTVALNTEIQSNEFASTPELVEKTPPNFEALDINNRFISLDNLSNKVVVMKFWFAACLPCIKEIPKLNSVFKKYKDNPDVIFLAPSLDDIATINRSNSKHPFSYTIIPKAQHIAHAYNVLGYPTHVVINKKGTVEAVFQGVNYNIDEKLSRAIESGLRRENTKSNTHLPLSTPIDDEVIINPNSVIVDEAGILIPFEDFVKMMNEGEYELFNTVDLVGNKVVMVKPAQRN